MDFILLHGELFHVVKSDGLIISPSHSTPLHSQKTDVMRIYIFDNVISYNALTVAMFIRREHVTSRLTG